jgi:hypothetical protein
MGILIAILVRKKLFFAFIHCFSDSARILSFFPLVDHGCEISVMNGVGSFKRNGQTDKNGKNN